MPRQMVYGLLLFFLFLLSSAGVMLFVWQNSSVQTKVAIVLLDGARADIVDKLIEEGKLMNLARLASNGVKAEYMLPVFPSLSMPGYSSIATGAYPGTTGITANAIHLAGEPLDSFHSVNSQYLLAEPLWKTADKAGLKTIVVSYEPSWPPVTTDGIVVSTIDLEMSGSRSQFYVTSPLQSLYQGSDLINVTTVNDASHAQESYSSVLQTSIPVASGPLMDALIVDTTDDGSINYDELLLSSNRTNETGFIRVYVGEWSNWVTCQISGQSSAFRFKLLQLSEDASKIALYKTAPFAVPDTQPVDIQSELWNASGPFVRDDQSALERGWIDEETYSELCETSNSWYVNATAHLMTRYDWQLLFTTTPITDWIGHRFMGYVTPGNPYYNVSTYQRYWNLIVQAYQQADELVGAVMERAGDDAYVMVVSDHGMAGVQKYVYVNSILMKAGLLNQIGQGAFAWQGMVDWKTTKAYCYGMGHIFVNLKDRDPNGTVLPEDYDAVCQQVIQSLYDVVDPDTGHRPIALAVKKADAHALGLFGDRVGDVIFSLHPEYVLDPPLVRRDGAIFGRTVSRYRTGQHGYLPFFTEMHSIFIADGPRLKSGALIVPVRAIDVAPTVAYLLNLGSPQNASGSIIINAINQ